MNKCCLKLITSLLFLSQLTFGQSKRDSLHQAGICDGSGYCIPQLQGLPRPRGFEVNYKKVLNYRIRTEISDSSYSGFIDRNRKWEIKFRFPVMLKNNFKIFVGVNYKIEEFRFEEQQSQSNEFYKSLDNKSLRSLGSSINIIKPFMGDKYLLGRVNFRLSGDFTQNKLNDYFRYSLTVIYGKRVSADISWGAGLNYSYTFGKQFIFPILAYSKKFSDKWSVEALLPVNVRFTYMVNDRNVFKFVNKISGDSYNINIEKGNQNNLFLEKSDLLSILVYEKEIHDFLWFSATIGNRFNLKFDLFEDNAFLQKSSPKITNSLADALFYEVSIFLVPPKKWGNKTP